MKAIAFSAALVGALTLLGARAEALVTASKWLQCSVADDNQGKRDFQFMFDEQTLESRLMLAKDSVLSAKAAADPFGVRADFGTITLVIDRESGYTHYEHFRYTSKGWLSDAVMTGLCRSPGNPPAGNF
jgi:hypothetical protein